jgi:hypothetical protein
MFLTMVRVDDKSNEMSKCTSVSCQFDGHTDAWVQGCLLRPVQHVQGYTGSLWTPPLGNYLLHIAPAATGQQANKQQSTNTPKKVAI